MFDKPIPYQLMRLLNIYQNISILNICTMVQPFRARVCLRIFQSKIRIIFHFVSSKFPEFIHFSSDINGPFGHRCCIKWCISKHLTFFSSSSSSAFIHCIISTMVLNVSLQNGAFRQQSSNIEWINSKL